MNELTTQDRNWAMVAHFSGALFTFLAPSMGFVGPGLVWLINQKDPAIVEHAREAFKFQLAMTVTIWILGAAGTVLSCFLVGFVFYLLAFIPWLAALIVPMLAGSAVNNGDDFTYPITGGGPKRIG